MKNIIVSLALLFCATFVATTASAQMTYQNGELKLTGTMNLSGPLKLSGNTALSNVTIGSNTVTWTGSTSTASSFFAVRKSDGSNQRIFSGDHFVAANQNAGSALTGATSTILKLKPVVYNLYTGAGFVTLNTNITSRFTFSNGFDLDNLSSVVSNSVAVDENGKKYVNYNEIIPLLVASIQEQNAEISALKQRIATLESR